MSSSSSTPTILTQRLSPLDALLHRIHSKIQERVTRPWYELQRNHFYKDTTGIKSKEELRYALSRFHVLLPPDDLELLWHSFPIKKENGEIWFDFKLMVSKMLKTPLPDANVVKDTPVFYLHPPSGAADTRTWFNGTNVLPVKLEGSITDATQSYHTNPFVSAGAQTINSAGGITRRTNNPTQTHKTQNNGSLPGYMQSKHRTIDENKYHSSCTDHANHTNNNIPHATFKSYPKQEYRHTFTQKHAK